jgi:hypothetical protein
LKLLGGSVRSGQDIPNHTADSLEKGDVFPGWSECYENDYSEKAEKKQDPHEGDVDLQV